VSVVLMLLDAGAGSGLTCPRALTARQSGRLGRRAVNPSSELNRKQVSSVVEGAAVLLLRDDCIGYHFRALHSQCT
jgi:hypothetical protein